MSIRRIVWALITLGLVTALLGAVAANAQDDGDAAGDSGELQLVILHHNDGESQLVQASSDLPDLRRRGPLCLSGASAAVPGH